MKLPKGTQKAVSYFLRSNYSGTDADRLLAETERLFNQFISEAPAPGGLNILRKQYYGGLSIFAFYEVMDRNVPEDVLQEILWSMLLGGGDIRRKRSVPVRLEGGLTQKIGYAVIRWYSSYVDRKIDSGRWENVWRIHVNPYNRKNGLCMPLSECPVARFAKRYGYEHLMPLFCGSDYEVARKYGLKLIRTHTEAEGYDDCDFWYLNERSEEK